MIFGNKRKNEIEFAGTLGEFVAKLYDLGFWENDETYKKYISEDVYSHFNNTFLNYSANLDEKSISFGKGLGVSSVNSRPTYPDETIVRIYTEGYTNEEINEAIHETLKKLEKQRDSENSV
ncbi:hypothetical protein [Oceanobacillus timonensis]|uniref:hypothetical protein n=1 Tax=Oceanobacillus timonensis TaxID=1926285 RepID=UPI0009B9EB61|nr:hypothetical protein [Oceanobacillus timonensis]